MLVIGTAGHIDHGKSTLVRHLTGIDPDRLAEEKQRGMTIDLGFAWFDLPSGRTVSVVDVPGHERFVRTMLAGAGGIDLALIVVAADEGVMAQTREHLAILDLLGVRHGVVALTKCDLVDDDWIALVSDDVDRLMSGTGLEGVQIVPVSAKTGHGIVELCAVLDAVAGSLPTQPSINPMWLPIDRAFVLPGYGTVVTGTLHGGELRLGQDVWCSPAGMRGRVRGLQVHRQDCDSAPAGARVAVNLAGEATSYVTRGAVLSGPDSVVASTRLVARVQVPATATAGMPADTFLMVHLGSAESPARARPLGGIGIEPGGQGWTDIVVQHPVPVVRGQRFVLRQPSPIGTVAGGVILDVAPMRRRLRHQDVPRLQLLLSADPVDIVEGVVADSVRRTPLEIARVAGLRLDVVEVALEGLLLAGKIVRVGPMICASTAWHDVLRRGRAEVDAYHREYPLRPGIPGEHLRRRLRLLPSEWHDALTALESSQSVRTIGTALAVAGRPSALTSRAADADAILAALRSEPFSPPSAAQMIEGRPADPDLLAALTREGKIVRLLDDLYFERSAFDRMLEATLDRIAGAGQVTVVEIREEFRTSRKYVVAFLEYLDDRRITRRVGDARVLGSGGTACG